MSLGDTDLSWVAENPAKVAEEGAESFKQKGRGASKRPKRRGRGTRKEASRENVLVKLGASVGSKCCWKEGTDPTF